MFITSKDGKEFEINIKDLDDAVRKHCQDCDEFVGLYSDLSIGASGAPKGHSIIIIRTEKGQNLMHSLIADGFIDKYKIPADQISEWKPRKENWFRKMTTLKIKK
jgi:coenzyme F420-reducing hydrogenase beta subunit